MEEAASIQEVEATFDATLSPVSARGRMGSYNDAVRLAEDCRNVIAHRGTF